MTRAFLRCHASDCRRFFAIDSDTEEAILAAELEGGGIRVSCSRCRLPFLYRAAELVVMPEAPMSRRIADGARAAVLAH